MFDVKEIKNVVQQIASTRQLSEDSLWEAIEAAFAAAYKKEYAKNDQIIRARINRETGEPAFFQVKQVMDDGMILPEEETSVDEDETRVRFNSERHIMVSDANLVRQGVKAGEEILFPLEVRTDFGRIAAQSARQAVTQKIHEAEREAVMSEFEEKKGTLVHGQIQRIERGNVYVDLGRTIAILPISEQIPRERFKQGDTIQAYVISIDTTRRSGGFVRLSRASEQFVVKLFEMEVPELSEGVLEVKAIARDPGVRTKIAIESKSPSVDPIGSLVGQRGIRVMTVKSELGGEQIDIIGWSDVPEHFVAEALLPAEVLEVTIDAEKGTAAAKASDEQIPVAIGRGGQNLKLAARLSDRSISIIDAGGTEVARAGTDGTVQIWKQETEKEKEEEKSEENEQQEEEKVNESVQVAPEDSSEEEKKSEE